MGFEVAKPPLKRVASRGTRILQKGGIFTKKCSPAAGYLEGGILKKFPPAAGYLKGAFKKIPFAAGYLTDDIY